MTREEAIEVLSDIDHAWRNFSQEEYAALEMAIQALSAEPCEDCISRAEALKEMQIYHDDCAKTSEYTRLGFETAMEVVKGLPSVQPKPKTNVLDKIRAEIMDTGAYEQEVHGDTEFLHGINYCINVIDKYKAESEDEE